MTQLFRHSAGIVLIATCLVALAIPDARGANPNIGPEQLIIFLQPDAGPVDPAFSEQYLPRIRALAESMDIPVTVKDPRSGAPRGVTLTPLMVYQNPRGRAIYQGRFNTLGRLRNFIRTARYVPQGTEGQQRQQIPVWRRGRTRLWAPLKISPVTGRPPDGYDHTVFTAEAVQSIKTGFRQFEFRDTASFGRGDRAFYMDFYPWRSADGTLFLSLALFSQFHCKKPVFETADSPLVGPWRDRDKLFRDATARMEAAVVSIVSSPESGDSFSPLAESVPVTDWEAMGLALPAAPERVAGLPPVSTVIPRFWSIAKPGPDDPPPILFRFPAPLDQYSGEAPEVTGHLTLPINRKLEDASGHARVATPAVTMGGGDLDAAIRGSLFLNTKKFPGAEFELTAATGDNRAIGYGRLTPATFHGTFTLKGKSVPLAWRGEIEPVLGNDTTPRLLVRGTIKIDVRTFDIEGAEGPAPTRYTLLMDLNLTMTETEQNR